MTRLRSGGCPPREPSLSQLQTHQVQCALQHITILEAWWLCLGSICCQGIFRKHLTSDIALSCSSHVSQPRMLHCLKCIVQCPHQGWTPRPAGNPPRGEGGVPRPAPHCGEGGVPRPDPPRKNDQNRGEVAGQNKGLYLNFLQKRKLMMEQYHNTEHE